MEKVYVCKKNEIEDESSQNFLVGGRNIVIIRRGDQFFAYRNVCLHKGGPMQYNHFQKELVCDWHGATYSPETGEVLTPPAPVGALLPKVELEVTDEEIYALIDEV